MQYNLIENIWLFKTLMILFLCVQLVIFIKLILMNYSLCQDMDIIFQKIPIKDTCNLWGILNFLSLWLIL